MPRFSTTTTWSGRGVRACRVACDGCDEARPAEEFCDEAQLWFVTAGAFEIRFALGRHVLDPGHALLVRAGTPFRIRHPVGADVCVSFRGPLVDELAARGDAVVPLSVADQASLGGALAAWSRGDADELLVSEVLGAFDAPASRPRRIDAASRAERDLTSAVEHVLGLHFAEPASLDEIAARAGYSTFHACRTFRATTGRTIHAHRLELRLRHALALLLDGELALADVAARAGFASQSHLTNRFRARFGTTPGRARAGAAVTSP